MYKGFLVLNPATVTGKDHIGHVGWAFMSETLVSAKEEFRGWVLHILFLIRFHFFLTFFFFFSKILVDSCAAYHFLAGCALFRVIMDQG